MALFVRKGGSRHTGQAAPPQRNIQFGLLEERAVAVNEEAYELLCGMEENLLKDLDVERTYAEKYALREQVRRIVEEIVLREVVNVFH